MSNVYSNKTDVSERSSDTHNMTSGDPPSSGKPGPASAKPKTKNRRKKRKPKTQAPQPGAPDTSVATDYATGLMDQTFPTPPVEAELRMLDKFQSVMTGTLFHLVTMIWHIARMPETIFEPALFVASQITFDGYIFAFFIVLAISIQMSFVTDQLVSQRLGHRANKMTKAIYRELGDFYTIDRGIAVMKFLGVFTTSMYETIFPSYILDAHGFLLLAWIYSVKHIVVCLGLANAWCRTRDWKQIFHNQETSRCGVADMDAPGAAVDTWFACYEYGAGALDGLVLRITRMFIDEEDFQITFASLVACSVVNTWNCTMYVKGETVNPGADYLLVDNYSRSIIDLYYYNPQFANHVPIVIDRQGNVVHNVVACRAASPIDPFFNAAQAAGQGKYTVNVHMRHVFAVLRDVNRGRLTRAGTVYLDSNIGGPRAGAGVDLQLCEAVMMVLSYGGMTPCDENYLEKLTTFVNYFHGDGRYYQDDNAGNRMIDNGLYTAFFEKHLTLLIPTVKSFCKFIPSIYLQSFKQYGLKLFKLPTPKITGSITQLFTSIPCFRGSTSPAFMDRIDNVSDYRPSLIGSSVFLTEVRKNDLGLLVAPSIIVERVSESSVLSGGSYQVASRAFVENPACSLRQFPDYNPGYQ